ncbi:hypothetical protein CR513_28849, partial [Mucuna pruriens]
MTARTKIDVHVETLSMEFGDNLVQFNIFEAMKHPTKDPSLFGIDSNQPRVESDSGNQSRKQLKVETNSAHQVPDPDRVGQPKPRPTNDISPLHSPPKELKSLPGHLKYAYLENDQQFLVIIANNVH